MTEDKIVKVGFSLDEARTVWRTRPTEGTQRERQAWANGFTEAMELIGGTQLVLAVTTYPTVPRVAP